MGFLDKAKAAAETAAEKAKDVAETATTKAKEGVDEVQTKRALGNAYEGLGKTAYELAQAGKISHPKMAEAVEEISKLEAHLAEAGKPPAAEPEPEPEAEAALEPAPEAAPAGQAPPA